MEAAIEQEMIGAIGVERMVRRKGKRELSQ